MKEKEEIRENNGRLLCISTPKNHLSKSLPNLKDGTDMFFELHPSPSQSQADFLSPEEDKKKQGRSPTKSLFKGSTFCLSPQYFRLKFKSAKEPSINHHNKKLLDVGISTISRSSPKSSLLSFNTLLNSLPSGDPVYDAKAQLQISRHLWHLKMLVYGGDGCTEKILKDKNHALLMQTVIKSGFLTNLVMKLEVLSFEDRKTACLLLSNLFRRPVSEGPMVLYFQQNPKLMIHLFEGCQHPCSSVALSCGKILLECTHYEPLAKQILESDSFYGIFEVLKGATFEVAADAFITLKSIVLGHKSQMSSYLKKEENYSTFFKHMSKLFICNNYVTKISTLELLAAMLIDRCFFDQMEKYIKSPGNLKKIIVLMSSSSNNLKVAGFQVFKLFLVGNNPPIKIKNIFTRNRERLMQLISEIDGTSKYGKVFSEEKMFVIRQLRDIDKDKEKNKPCPCLSDKGTNTEGFGGSIIEIDTDENGNNNVNVNINISSVSVVDVDDNQKDTNNN